VAVWDVAEREDTQIAANLFSRACLHERISRRRHQPSIFHNDNGNAMSAATLDARLEGAAVVLTASGQQRKHLVGFPVPHHLRPTELPTAAIPEPGRRLCLGGGIRGLVQPPAPPQRHRVRDA
jgi:hypothetical protein